MEATHQPGSEARPGSRIRRTAGEAITALEAIPGGRELLALAEQRPGISLVGGATRDLLLGLVPRELDVAVHAGAGDLAAALAAKLPHDAWPGAEPQVPTLHDRFGTASVQWIHGRVDVAEQRAESYPHPGALPEVRPGNEAEDLARRDFTVNAIALPLERARRGEIAAAEHALEDLAAGQMRVLHDRSFIDDPTRLLRLVRYHARLGFEIEPLTRRLAETAVEADALATVSRARVGAELRLATEEPGERALCAMGEFGVLAALGLPPRFDEQLAREASALTAHDLRQEILRTAVLFHPPHGDDDPAARAAAARLMDQFEFTAATRERVLAGAFGAEALAAELGRPLRPSQLHALLAGRPPEAVALAGAIAARRFPRADEHARLWFDELRGVKLQITGEDLLAAGVPEGPEIGRRLARVLARRLDGETADTREAQLEAALEASA
jgi:tRNA nucleotidyltransferase (CCA-adding enzyme)